MSDVVVVGSVCSAEFHRPSATAVAAFSCEGVEMGECTLTSKICSVE